MQVRRAASTRALLASASELASARGRNGGESEAPVTS